jgi:ornithine carbamoyltransferase
MFAGAQLGADVWIASPSGYTLDADSVEWAQARCSQTNASVTITQDPRLAASDADVIYADVWTSMGQEAETEARKQVFAPYQINERLFGLAKDDAIFLHCLPAHRGEEVTSEVIDGPQSFVFQQAENRLHAQKAIMVELMKWTRVPEQEAAREPMLELVK